MGYYIETSNNKGKAKEIAEKYQGRIVNYYEAVLAMRNNEGVIVVVENDFFEAAGFCYDDEEFEAFTRMDDYRPKTFVVITREDAEKASGYRREDSAINS